MQKEEGGRQGAELERVTTIEIVGWQRDPGEAVAEAAAMYSLQVASDGTLKSLPGSRHWHLKRPKEPGTLEITYCPNDGRLWVCYHSNRAGRWVPELAMPFAKALARRLDGRTVSTSAGAK